MNSFRPIWYQPRRWPDRELTAFGAFVYSAPYASRGAAAVDLDAAIRVAEVEAVPRGVSTDALVAEASRVAETRSASWASEERFDALIVLMGDETHTLAQISRATAVRALIAAGMPHLAEIVRDRHAGLRLRFLLAFDGERVAIHTATRPQKEWPVWRRKRPSAAARRERRSEEARLERIEFECRQRGEVVPWLRELGGRHARR